MSNKFDITLKTFAENLIDKNRGRKKKWKEILQGHNLQSVKIRGESELVLRQTFFCFKLRLPPSLTLPSNHTIYSCSVRLCLGALPDTLLEDETSSVWWLQTVDGPLWQQQNKSFHTCSCQHVWHLDRKPMCESLNSLRCQPRYQPNITVTLTDVVSAPQIQTGSWCQRI